MRKFMWYLAVCTIGIVAFGSIVQAACEIAISGNDMIQYDKKEVKVEASCETVTITLTHTGKLPRTAMGHNVVVSKTSDMAGVIADGSNAGVDANYVPRGDKRVIVATKLIGGGESTTANVKGSALEKGGDYSFFCTFPGHSVLMKGKLIVE